MKERRKTLIYSVEVAHHSLGCNLPQESVVSECYFSTFSCAMEKLARLNILGPKTEVNLSRKKYKPQLQSGICESLSPSQAPLLTTLIEPLDRKAHDIGLNFSFQPYCPQRAIGCAARQQVQQTQNRFCISGQSVRKKLGGAAILQICQASGRAY